MDSSDPISLLDQSQYLFLRKIWEPIDNSLILTIEQGVPGRAAQVNEELSKVRGLAEILKGARVIESTDDCLAFQLTWDRYVAYLVTEESAGSCGEYDDEKYTGRFFRVYSKSHFLSHLAKDTGVHQKPFQHFKLICQNHLIDVAAPEPPEVEILKASPRM